MLSLVNDDPMLFLEYIADNQEAALFDPMSLFFLHYVLVHHQKFVLRDARLGEEFKSRFQLRGVYKANPSMSSG